MNIITVTVGSIRENVYIYYDEQTHDGVVIDPGFETDKILKHIEQGNINVKAILLTHGHFDHIYAVEELKAATNSKVFACKHEKSMLNDAELNLAKSILKEDLSIEADVYLEDGEQIQAGSITLTLLHTPGHTQGGSCYYADGVLFSGDTLFHEAIGRTDLPLADTASLLTSIRQKLFVLPEDTKVYPGHGMSTTIGYEKTNNPYFDEDGLI